MSVINIVALGGVQETGKNLYVVEVDNDLFILDSGMKYPSSDIRGVDIIIPDISYIISNSNKVRGIFLSHAHDDHIMAVPHILKYMRIPVYASKFTISVLKELLVEHGLNPIDFQLIVVDEGTPIRFGKTFVKFINVSHSVPQSMAIVISTVDGNILYTGNYNFDQNDIDGGGSFTATISYESVINGGKLTGSLTDNVVDGSDNTGADEVWEKRL